MSVDTRKFSSYVFYAFRIFAIHELFVYYELDSASERGLHGIPS